MFINAGMFHTSNMDFYPKENEGAFAKESRAAKEVRKSGKLQKIDFHGADGAGGDAQLAAVALFRVKQDFLCLLFKG